jgi:hypothetical protein
MSASFTSKLASFIGKHDAAVDRALATMSTDIERMSKMQVPHDTGKLQNSGSTRRLGFKKFRVEYNTPYARRWEFETPSHGFKQGRKSRYLRDPAELVSSRAKTYIKEAISIIGAA